MFHSLILAVYLLSASISEVEGSFVSLLVLSEGEVQWGPAMLEADGTIRASSNQFTIGEQRFTVRSEPRGGVCDRVFLHVRADGPVVHETFMATDVSVGPQCGMLCGVTTVTLQPVSGDQGPLDIELVKLSSRVNVFEMLSSGSGQNICTQAETAMQD